MFKACISIALSFFLITAVFADDSDEIVQRDFDTLRTAVYLGKTLTVTIDQIVTGLPHWKRAAEQGSGDASLLIYMSSTQGYVKINEAERNALFEHIENNGSNFSKAFLSLVLLGMNEDTKYSSRIVSLLTASTLEGELLAVTSLAELLHFGRCAPQDRDKANELYNAIASLDHPFVHFQLGRHTDANNSPEQKISADAIKWFKSAADNGHAQANSLLASTHPTETELEEALYYYERAANLGDVSAFGPLGILKTGAASEHRDNLGIRLAAMEPNSGASSFFLASIYANPETNMFDASEAIYWAQVHIRKTDRPSDKIKDIFYALAGPQANPESYGSVKIADTPENREAFYQLADLVSVSPVEELQAHNKELLFYPFRQAIMHHQNQYVSDYKQKASIFQQIFQVQDEHVSAATQDAYKLFTTRAVLNLLNEEHGYTMASSLGNPQKEFWRDLSPILIDRGNTQNFLTVAGGIASLLADIDDRNYFSGIVKFADMKASDEIGALWNTKLMPLARGFSDDQLRLYGIEAESIWKNANDNSGAQFQMAEALRIHNRSPSDLNNVIIKVRVENDWIENGTTFAFVRSIRQGTAITIPFSYRFRERYSSCSRSILVSYELHCVEGYTNPIHLFFECPQPASGLEDRHDNYRILEADVLAKGNSLFQNVHGVESTILTKFSSVKPITAFEPSRPIPSEATKTGESKEDENILEIPGDFVFASRPFREWTDVTGKFKCIARVCSLSVVNGVELEKQSNADRIFIAWEALSRADQKHLLMEARTAGEPKSSR